MKIKLTLIEEMLGTKPCDPKVFGNYVASKHPTGTPQRDELENAEVIEELGTTVFHREKADGDPMIYDYQIKGFFKDACGAMNRFDKEARSGLEKLTAYKSKIDGCIFVTPRLIAIKLSGPMGLCERPLRTDGPMGPRVALARSETVPAGSTLEFTLDILSKDLMAYVQAWLGYGRLRGLGQWRNSGKGRFTWAEQE